ncbi:hypothetical protein E3Q16_02812 [Wallemia mellicola]|nr:hypothetical protein E3Q16_02812 [Wallemia mellicola]TIC16179.1 hypothetical protein E3Q13_03066 [Wallemia mellicola]
MHTRDMQRYRVCDILSIKQLADIYSALHSEQSLIDICNTIKIEEKIEKLDGQPDVISSQEITLSAIEDLLFAFKKLSAAYDDDLLDLDSDAQIRMINLLCRAASISMRATCKLDVDPLSFFSTASSLTTTAYLLGGSDSSRQTVNALALQSLDLQKTHAIVEGMVGHDMALLRPIEVSKVLLDYAKELKQDQYHSFVISISQHTPTIVNLLALANHSIIGQDLTAFLIDIDHLHIVNDWAAEAKMQIQSTAKTVGAERLNHLIKASILNQFFVEHTGTTLEAEKATLPAKSSELPVIDAPDWFKEQSAKFASTQKVYSSNEFRTLRMAAQGIRAPSKHVDSFE